MHIREERLFSLSARWVCAARWWLTFFFFTFGTFLSFFNLSSAATSYTVNNTDPIAANLFFVCVCVSVPTYINSKTFHMLRRVRHLAAGVHGSCNESRNGSVETAGSSQRCIYI